MFRAALALFLLISLSGCKTNEVAVSQPPIIQEVKQKEAYVWDFGKLKAGTVAEHSFIFINNTDKPLNITGVNTSCGCTASEVKKKALNPGESTSIVVRFNSAGYSGNVTQFVYVNTDSTDQPFVKFQIKAEVIKTGG